MVCSRANFTFLFFDLCHGSRQLENGKCRLFVQVYRSHDVAGVDKRQIFVRFAGRVNMAS